MAAEGEEVVRIYVSGLSSCVTAADVEKTFSPLGLVRGVDLVRTKDRSLAFFDFRPSSGKAIAKLFSTYNGCTWKGGRLRVEKAKENYLTRLKGERMEDATITDDVPIKPSKAIRSENFSKTEISNQENMDLRIFFPKSRKVKSLPFKGTGKHKYSFQRIDVPPLPVHFCDREDHCKSTDRTGFENLSPRTETFERERSIMNSVMKKFVELDDRKPIPIEKVKSFKDYENLESVTIEKVKSVKDYENLECVAIDATRQDEQEEDYSDSDNLLTNMVVGGRTRDSRKMNWLTGGESHSVDQELANLKEARVRKDRMPKITGNPQKVQKRIDSVATSANDVFSGELVNDEATLTLPGCEGSLGHSQKAEISAVAPTYEARSEGSKGITKSQSRTLTSSWKDLASGMSKNSFSLSNVLTDVNEISPKLPLTVLAKNSINPKKRGNIYSDNPKSLQSDRNLSAVPTNAEIQKRDDDPKSILENAGLAAEVNDVREPGRNVSNSNIDKVWAFMRTASSEKECADTKPYEDVSGEVNDRPRPTPILDVCQTSLGHSPEAEITLAASTFEVRAEGSEGATQSQSFMQKFSWKDFVGGTSHNSFTISDAWMGVNEVSPKLAPDLANNTTLPKKREKPFKEEHKLPQSCPEVSVGPTSVMMQEKDGALINMKGACLAMEVNRDWKSKRNVPQIKPSEVCTFMRTATSEKEWAETKAALSGYLQKKGSEAGASKSSKSKWIHNN